MIERAVAAQNAGISGYPAPGYLETHDEPSASGPIVDIWTFGPQAAERQNPAFTVLEKMEAMHAANEAEAMDFVDALSASEIEALDVGIFQRLTQVLPKLKLAFLKHPHAW